MEWEKTSLNLKMKTKQKKEVGDRNRGKRKEF